MRGLSSDRRSLSQREKLRLRGNTQQINQQMKKKRNDQKINVMRYKKLKTKQINKTGTRCAEGHLPYCEDTNRGCTQFNVFLNLSFITILNVLILTLVRWSPGELSALSLF